MTAAHDAARRPARRRPAQPRPRSRAGGAVRVRARLPGRAGAGRGRAAGGPLLRRIAAPVREPHRLADSRSAGSRRRGWARRAGDAAGFFALKGVLELLAGRARRGLAREPASEPFLHPGRAAAVASKAPGPDGSASSIRSSPGLGPAGAVAFELDLAPLVASARSARAYEDVTTHPAVLQDLAVTVADDVSAERVRAAVRAGGGSCSSGPRSSTSTAAISSGGGQEPRPAARVPRPRQDADRRGGRRAAGAIKAALAEIGASLRE